MNWRLAIASALWLIITLAIASAAIKTIWPPERHPLAVDAKAMECPRIGPLNPNMVPQRAPIMDPRRTA